MDWGSYINRFGPGKVGSIPLENVSFLKYNGQYFSL